MIALSGLIETPFFGETCSRTIYQSSAFFSPSIAAIGFFCTMGMVMCFVVDGFFMAHIAERIVFNRDMIERYHRWVIAFAVVVSAVMAIVFAALNLYQLSPSSIAPYTSTISIVTVISFAGFFIIGGALCISMVIVFLLKSAFDSRFLYHSASKATTRAAALLMVQWRTFLLIWFVFMIWVFSLLSYRKTDRFNSLFFDETMSPVFAEWFTCLFTHNDRGVCQTILGPEASSLTFILIPGLLSGVYHLFMPIVLLFRSSVFDSMRQSVLLRRFQRSSKRSSDTSFSQMAKMSQGSSHPTTSATRHMPTNANGHENA
ncbi:hypothetical protein CAUPRSCDRAFT_11932 [Caulochytrium protostelioides]|nr:hypothetical protein CAUPRSCDRAFT_11932 [Caulochytrium protostelioides]